MKSIHSNKRRTKLTILLLLFVIHLNAQPVPHSVCFYYNWYGSKANDGENYHWKHPVMPENDKDTTKKLFPGNGDIGANYYPSAGEYSNCDSNIIKLHMQQLASAGFSIVVVTWLGKDDYTYKSLPLIFNYAEKNHLKISFQIEPCVRKSAIATVNEMQFIINQFGNEPAFYRDEKTNKPMFFVYDSYVIPANEWNKVFSRTNDELLFRNTKYDADVIGLFCWKEDTAFFQQAGFDGMYTYFASRGFTFGSNPDNWNYLQDFADRRQLKFIPSVGPGYNDNRIRPWNKKNTKDREKGAYFDRFFEDAIKCNLDWIGVTSFNEWHEGTQIEPAKSYQYNDAIYLDYEGLPDDYYLTKTRYYLQKWNLSRLK
ncbi:MAG: glycoside hydrolase family 99 protein [Bacteroidota bacterium]